MGLDTFFICIGILYGYLKPGIQEPEEVFTIKGAKLGIIVAFIYGLLVAYTGALGPFSLIFGISFLGVLFGIVYVAVLVTTGVILGDFLEIKIKK